LADGQLLERFVTDREEAAFEALVKRHGPLVWGVCRRILRDHHAAEDCFQAVFLVLARKAASIASRELLANWLYGVAHNAARKAGAANMKRRAREKQLKQIPEPAMQESPESDVLDLEPSRLPEKYRVAILLCEVQGKSHQEAAQQVGCPVGTLSGRLSRARAMLAKRLARRGLVLPTGMLAAQGTAPAAVIASTVRATIGGTAGFVSTGVVDLTEGVLKGMLFRKLKNAIVMVSLGAGAVAGWAILVSSSQTPQEARPVIVGLSAVQGPAEAGGEKYHFQEDLKRYVGLLRQGLVTLGHLDAKGNFIPLPRVEPIDSRNPFFGPVYTIINAPGRPDEPIYEFRSGRLIRGKLTDEEILSRTTVARSFLCRITASAREPPGSITSRGDSWSARTVHRRGGQGGSSTARLSLASATAAHRQPSASLLQRRGTASPPLARLESTKRDTSRKA
jgi:RNA polymerase sigma factor (sigma-70 family)